jgi:hypothetical protein
MLIQDSFIDVLNEYYVINNWVYPTLIGRYMFMHFESSSLFWGEVKVIFL